MAGGRVYSGGASSSSLSVLLQNQRGPCASEPLDSLFLSGSSNSSSASPFLGTFSLSFLLCLCFSYLSLF